MPLIDPTGYASTPVADIYTTFVYRPNLSTWPVFLISRRPLHFSRLPEHHQPSVERHDVGLGRRSKCPSFTLRDIDWQIENARLRRFPDLWDYRRHVESEKRSEKFRWIRFRFPDDSRSFWVYLPVVVLIAFVEVQIWDDALSNVKVQAIAALGLAILSMIVCFFWAFSLWRATVSSVQYVCGTKTSRSMVWFWAVVGAISAGAPFTGIGGQSFVPLWEHGLVTFAGLGSVLLTVGPAYKEYREAIDSAPPTVDTDNHHQQVDDDDALVTNRTDRGLPALTVVLAIGLVIISLGNAIAGSRAKARLASGD